MSPWCDREEIERVTIVMIQGPDACRHAPEATDAVHAALSRRARSAGQHLIHVKCDTQAQLAERLARIDRGQADIILLDAGRAARDATLDARLAHLTVPYIEVHSEQTGHSAPAARSVGPRLAVIDGYQAQGYTLAMSLALETLGCAESENDVHVGT